MSKTQASDAKLSFHPQAIGRWWRYSQELRASAMSLTALLVCFAGLLTAVSRSSWVLWLLLLLNAVIATTYWWHPRRAVRHRD